ncbi:MAG: alpha-2-macroglobulin family protein [Chloroherpetonaceae bacterium]|nr:MG2 domain-containing protein [Chthonomonadaceae bacterium]MDW8208835.1 alpha-2-macroglobulin family protein [Chloroherpetonaceae bacterium]
MRYLGWIAVLIAFCTGLLMETEAGARGQRPEKSGMNSKLSPLETQVLGQSQWLLGSHASLRVVVADHLQNRPLRADVTIALKSLANGQKTHVLYQGRTDAVGTVNASFPVRDVPGGPAELQVHVKTPIGSDEVRQNVQIVEQAQVMLTADKPIYQPGQVIHMRALALDLGTRRPLADKPVVFEVEDARGNKVFKKKETLSPFGIASADFALADEVNMGTFTLRALLPNGQAEKKVRVERYVLPKFKITLTPDKPYYLPGEVVKVVTAGKYFFGKPVAGGEMTLTINTLDIGVTKLKELKAKTDPLGSATFRYTLPGTLVGQEFEQGKAVIELVATLKDTADHQQEARITVPVVKDPIQLVIVPEARTIVPGVENRIFIAVATPDGQPLSGASVRVQLATRGARADARTVTQELTTDRLGIAEMKFTPPALPAAAAQNAPGDAPGDPVRAPEYRVAVEATDGQGRKARVERTFTATAPGQEAVLLRVDRPMARVGDRLTLTALSTTKGGTLYIDVIRNRQTILTHAQPFKGGQAQCTLPVTADMVGTLELHAYRILPDENIIRDTRTVVVSQADDLNIQVTADQNEYRPGAEGRLHFTVRGKSGPLRAALGLAMVDESVFALSELQPGLEKIYFTLEKELMEPRYEIHGLRPTFLVEPRPRPLPVTDLERQRAATMLLAALPPRTDFDFRRNTYRERWEQLRQEVVEEMMATCRKILDALQKFRQAEKRELTAAESLRVLVDRGYLKPSDLRDRWGNPYRANLYGQKTYHYGFTLSSAGPDGRWGTNDDVLEVSAYVVGFGGRGGVRERNMFLMRGVGPVADGVVAQEAAQEGPRALARAPGAEFQKKADGAPAGREETIRVREYFPETMLWQPALITDDSGRATLSVRMADSITTWRLSVTGNDLQGLMGSTTVPVRVFQDFFVDIDLPVSLTQNDRVDIPVAVYNYLQGPQEVTLTLKQEPWFTLNGKAEQTIRMEPGQVRVIHYPITVKAIGRHALQVTARGSRLSDAIRRVIDVLPDGKEYRPTINDRLEGRVEKTLTLPAKAIPEASTIWVKLYPGTFSQVVEGLDGLLRMPSGCFEQTSSVTYPNVLVLDYLKANKRINPEIQMKAEQYINVGYQRLVTFEVKGGGFSWFGDAPAHKVLTAYGLLEFSDMAKVHEVDPALIARTQQWLAGQQKPDGSWEEDKGGIAEGVINRQTGALRTTAYIAWALAESGYQGPEVGKGVAYVRNRWNEAKDPYTLAVLLNLLTVVERDGELTAQLANRLIEMATTTDKTAYWQSDTRTFTGAERAGADLETTGLAAYGLVKWGRNAGFVNKVLTYLVQSKNSFGAWDSTQGTVWSMKALLFASRNAVGSGKGTVVVRANGKEAAKLQITPEDSDVMRQIDLAAHVRPGNNTITLEYEGDGSLLYQIVGRYYLPWKEVEPPAPEFEPLKLEVQYDKTTLAQDDMATVTVTVKNVTDRIAEMPLIDLGVPPGFTVVPDNLEKAVAEKRISKYTLAARQVIIYLQKLDPGQELKLTYQVRAKFPIRARTPLSKVYPYYNPERVAVVPPAELTVTQ